MTDVLIQIAYAPRDAREGIETLEVVLGAASLELDVAVCLVGAGAGHLAGDFGRRWLQLTDFGLARLMVLDGGGGVRTRVPFEPVTGAEVEQARQKALTMMVL